MPTPLVSIDFCDAWDLSGRLKSALMKSVTSFSLREDFPNRVLILDLVDLSDAERRVIRNESELASITKTKNLATSIP